MQERTGVEAARAGSDDRWAVALGGAVSLAVAMGIGRFAFTPLLPMMLDDRLVDLQQASWLASANYLGYLVGALLCTFQPLIWSHLRALPAFDAALSVRAGLVATVLLTLAMALPAPLAWPTLRFAAGVASAVVFVFTSGWCLSRLAERGATALGGVMYTGPGAGIVASGLAASVMVSWHWRAAAGWLAFGLLAAILTAAVWRTFVRGPAPAASVPPSAPPRVADRRDRVEVGLMAIAYGLAGFGYIISATFLPVIARQALPGSAWLDLFWPLFGTGVVAGALISARWHVAGDLRLMLAGCYVVQALAIAASFWRPSLAGFAFGSLLLGLPFTAITFYAMREARRLRPALAASTMGLLTACYGVGQIGGPPLVAVLLERSATPGQGFTLALQIAAAGLLIGALMYAGLARAFPLADAATS